MTNFTKIKKIIKDYFTKKSAENFGFRKSKVPLAIPPYSWEEVYESLESLLSMETTMSKKVKLFEKKFARYLGVKYALMVNSGSSANLLALSILSNPLLKKKRISNGDEIITPAVTWATTVYPIVNIGAKPVFVDVDLKTRNIKSDEIEKAITKKTKAILPVHLLGYPCDMKKILKLAHYYDLYVIEDACEAHGSKYFGKKVGSFGNLATFSFFASHHITTMEGGMVVTNDPQLYEIGKSLRVFGWIRDLKDQKQYRQKFPQIDPRFLFINTGYNMRPTEIQGAFGIHQIKKLDHFIKIRRDNSEYLNKKLSLYSDYLILPQDEKGYFNSYLAYPITVIENKFFEKDDLVRVLEKNGIETRPIMAGNITQQPVIKFIPHRIHGKLPNSQYIMKNSFLIANHQGINKKMRKYEADTITKFLEKKILNSKYN